MGLEQVLLASLPRLLSQCGSRFPQPESVGSAGILHRLMVSLEKTASKGVTISLWLSPWALIPFLSHRCQAQLHWEAVVLS